MKTGPHSFTDPTGVEWHIEGYSRACGAAYVDCRSTDGKALTVRPVAYLAPAGLSIPEGAEPPRRPASASEKKHAHEEAEKMVGHPIEKVKAKRAPRKKKEPEPVESIPGQPELSAEGGWAAEERGADSSGVGAQVIPFPLAPAAVLKAHLAVGRYVLLHVSEAGEGYATSWDTWAEAHDAFPLDAGFVLEDSTTGERWAGPGGCECGNCCHEHYGCVECGDKTGACTPTACKSGGEEPSQAASGDTAAPDAPASKRARVVNAHRAGYDVLIARPSAWGNPYSHDPNSAAQHIVESRERAIDLYREWLRQRVRDAEPGLVPALAALHGLRLGCYCSPEPCHGDVLVEAAAWAAAELSSSPQSFRC